MRLNIIITVLSLGLLASCQKDIDIFIPDVNQSALDSSWTASPPTELPIQASIFLPPQKDTIRFLGTGPFNFLASSGLTLQMRVGQWIDSSNVPANISPIYLESHWITRKGDLIRAQLDLTGNNAVIRTNGVSLVQLKNRNGGLLRVAPGSLFTFSVSSGPAQPDFFLRNTNWVPPTDSINRVRYNAQAQRLEFQTQFIGWMAAGNSLPLIAGNQVFITAPANFGNSNTLVFVMGDSDNWIRRASGNHTLRRFELNGLPSANTLRVVGISLINGQYYWANTTMTTAAGTSSLALTFSPTSLAGLLQALANL